MEDLTKSDFEHRYKTHHTQISIYKSVIRFFTSIIVVTGCILADVNIKLLLSIAAVGYGIAEIFGVFEEL